MAGEPDDLSAASCAADDAAQQRSRRWGLAVGLVAVAVVLAAAVLLALDRYELAAPAGPSAVLDAPRTGFEPVPPP